MKTPGPVASLQEGQKGPAAQDAPLCGHVPEWWKCIKPLGHGGLHIYERIPEQPRAAPPESSPAVLKDTQAPPQEDTDNTGRAATRGAPDAGAPLTVAFLNEGPACNACDGTGTDLRARGLVCGASIIARSIPPLDLCCQRVVGHGGPHRNGSSEWTSGEPTAGPSPSIPASPVPDASGRQQQEDEADTIARACPHLDRESPTLHVCLGCYRSAEAAAYARGRRDEQWKEAARLVVAWIDSAPVVDVFRGVTVPGLADLRELLRALAGTGAQPPSEEKSK